MSVNIRRAYDAPGARDGTRILVDGLWPRGVTRDELKISAWEKAIAPSKTLRSWYGHDPVKWPEFRKRYREELAEPLRKEALDRLVRLAGQGTLTLVFGARDAERSNAAVIAELILTKSKAGEGTRVEASRSPRKAKQ
ncbi:MAG: DUF488 family protein [Acidobacteria bacterium]|nr:MAG: DUF488 family protein [Acidobacteriota bacterium]